MYRADTAYCGRGDHLGQATVQVDTAALVIRHLLLSIWSLLGCRCRIEHSAGKLRCVRGLSEGRIPNGGRNRHGFPPDALRRASRRMLLGARSALLLLRLRDSSWLS